MGRAHGLGRGSALRLTAGGCGGCWGLPAYGRAGWRDGDSPRGARVPSGGAASGLGETPLRLTAAYCGLLRLISAYCCLLLLLRLIAAHFGLLRLIAARLWDGSAAGVRRRAAGDDSDETGGARGSGAEAALPGLEAVRERVSVCVRACACVYGGGGLPLSGSRPSVPGLHGPVGIHGFLRVRRNGRRTKPQ